METALTPIIKESKVPKSVADQVNQSLTPFFAKVQEWQQTIKTIVITDPSETGKMKMAREGRLALRQMRLDGTEIVKSNREIIKKRMESDVLEDKLWLKSGQIMELEYKTLEAQLEEKEKFAENFEISRKKALHATRATELVQYGWQDLGLMHLGEMDDGSYAALLNGTRIQHEEKLRAEAQATKERLEQEKKDILERERRNELNIKGLINYIPEYYTRKFCDLSKQEFEGITFKAENAKNEYLIAQQEIQKAKDMQANLKSSGFTIEQPPTVSQDYPTPKSDKARLIGYAEDIKGFIIPAFATQRGRDIYTEARGYIEKVAARIIAQADRL